MPLNLSKLENLVKSANGAMRARCPACAAAGQDRTGEHLRIAADGRFGCCVHPKDREHRSQIYALAGERSKPAAIKIHVSGLKANAWAQSGILSQIAQSLNRSTVGKNASDASDGEQPLPSETTVNDVVNSRTLRTSFLYSRGYIKKEEINTYTLKEFCPPVRCVRAVESGEAALSTPKYQGDGIEPAEKLPYLTPAGDLVIPFDSPERYHYWKDGQSPEETKEEILKRNGAQDESDF